MSNSGFLVQPVGSAVDGSVTERADGKWKKGDRGRILVRTQAFDPFSHEYAYISAHTPFTVVPNYDARHALQGHITVMLRSADNGSGRILSVPIEVLERTL